MKGGSEVSGVTEFLGHHDAMTRPEILSEGGTVDGWRVKAIIGRGGSSEVYRVQDGDGRVAALKILTKDDAAARARFAQEIALYASGMAKSLPRLYGSGEFEGHPYLTCELLEAIEPPGDDSGVAGYLLAVCKAVGGLHRAGLVHRDLKPSNIMRRANGELVLIDLGLVKDLTRGSSPQAGVSIVSERVVAVGTPTFAAPEQMQGGEISAAADIHAIGRIANVMLGERASRAWIEIIRRATSSVPSMRYRSVEELAGAIRRRNWRRNLRRAAVTALGAVALAVAAERGWERLPGLVTDLGYFTAELRRPADGGTYYVDGAAGDDANSGRSARSAKKTIQSAIDAAADGSVILVAAGHYAPIATGNRRIVIRSTEGREATVIDGEDRRRCADLGSELGETNTVLEGFSLVRGSVKGERGAGVRCGSLKNCLISRCDNRFDIWMSEGGGAWGSWAEDCEFADNQSTHGGGLAAGRADRCVFRGNHAHDDGGGVHSCRLRNCLVVGNHSDNWGGGGSGAAISNGTNYNCTVVRNVARKGGGVVSGNSELVNCILFDNRVSSGDQLYRGAKDRVTLKNVCESDPQFVNAQLMDFHLAAGSPCVDAGDNLQVDTDRDIDGNARIANGRVDLGCYEQVAR